MEKDWSDPTKYLRLLCNEYRLTAECVLTEKPDITQSPDTQQLFQTEECSVTHMPRGGVVSSTHLSIQLTQYTQGLPSHLAPGLSTQLQLALLISSSYLFEGALISEISCWTICMKLKPADFGASKLIHLKCCPVYAKIQQQPGNNSRLHKQ